MATDVAFIILGRAYAPDASASIDLTLGPTEPDNRGVTLIEFEAVDQWLFGTVGPAAGSVRLEPVEVFNVLRLST